eukprot:gene10464-14055_t
MEEENTLLLEVCIPEGAVSGSKITVQDPHDRFFEITVPDSAKPGDTINVLIPALKINDDTNVSLGESDELVEEKLSTSVPLSRGGMAAAAVTGVVIGTLVVGPVLTGLVVIGVALASHERNKTREFRDDSVIGKLSSQVKSIDEKHQITATVAAVSQQTVENLNKIDQKYEITAKTSAIASNVADTVKDIDSKYEISATTSKLAGSVTEKVIEIDTKYEISSTASKVVASGVEKINDMKISENLSALSTNALTTAKEIDSKYDVTNKLNSVFETTAAGFSSLFGRSSVTTASAPLSNNETLPRGEVIGSSTGTSSRELDEAELAEYQKFQQRKNG